MSLTCFLVAVSLTTASLSQGQTVATDNTPLDFGSANVCAPAKAPPAECSGTSDVHFKVTAGGTLGAVKVLTMGAPNQDFLLAGNTCIGNVATGSSCTVKVKFAPKFPGVRVGAVQLTDGSGNVVATRLLHGIGVGPQIDFDNGVLTTLAASPYPSGVASGIAVDGAGNVFFSGEGLVYEAPVSGEAPVSVGAGFDSPYGLALDGAGNLYVADWGANHVVLVPAGCVNTSCETFLDGGFVYPTAITVDLLGNIYVVDSWFSLIYKMPAGCMIPDCAVRIGGTWNGPYALAVDGAGNLFVAEADKVVKVNIGSGKQTTAVPNVISYGIAVDAAGDLYLNDVFNFQIVEEPAAGGPLITLARTKVQDWAVAVDGGGDVFFSSVGTTAVGELHRIQVPTYTFATTPVDTTSPDSPQPFLVQNTGNAALALSGLTLDPLANFALVPGPGSPPDCKTGFSLASGALCNLSISYTPISGGPVIDTAYLLNNTGNAPSALAIPLEGIGGPSGTSIGLPTGFVYPDGGYSTLGLMVNGGAAIGDNALQLTDGGLNESRSSFFSTPIGVTYFQTSFDFQLTGKDTPAPDADGIAFVLQENGPNALGSSGGGLGYGLPSATQPGTKITNSVALKFDLHNNDGEGTSSTGLYLNGAAPTVPSIDLLTSGINLHSGHVFRVVLVNNQSTLNFSITDQATKAKFSTQFPVDLTAVLGSPTAYAGFTGSTGSETAVQSILNWQLTSSACCMDGMPAFPAGFPSAASLTLNGSATIAAGSAPDFANTLQLTQGIASEASSAYYSTAIPVDKFTSDFDFQLSRGEGEGFTFVLQSEGLNAVGSSGGGLGYGPAAPGGAGAKISNSVAVKFDLYSDAGEGSNSTGVFVGGASPTVPASNTLPAGINLHSGHEFHAQLSYDGAQLRVSITDLTQYAAFTETYPVNIPAAVGSPNAYAGFTAATGTTGGTVKILNWHMTSF